MSKFEVTTKKALDRITKTAGTIKVVTLLSLRITPLDKRYLLPFPSEDEVNGENGFVYVSDLPTNLKLEHYMNAVKSLVEDDDVSPRTKREFWDQFTIFVELTKDDGMKIFDFKFPFTVDEDWDTTLGDIYDIAQVETAKLREADSKKKQDTKGVAIGKAKKLLNKVTKSVKITKDICDQQTKEELIARNTEESIRPKSKNGNESSKRVVKNTENIAKKRNPDDSSSKKEVKVYTRKDFDKAVGKNLILRVYNF